MKTSKLLFKPDEQKTQGTIKLFRALDTGDQMTEIELREVNNNLNLILCEMREINRHLGRIADNE